MVAVLFTSVPVRANIFTKILREAGEAGSKAARHGIDIPGGVGRFIAKLPQKPGHLALEAHVSPEGHWKFVNGKGDVFTAASPEEMSRVVKMLSPDGGASRSRLSLYLSEETLFENARFLDKLPKGSVQHIVVGKQSFLIDAVSKGGGLLRFARVRPNVLVPLSGRKAFDEAIWQLSRPLRKADIRVISLRTGARPTLSSAPRFDKTTGQPLVDVIEPDALFKAMTSVSGQTLLVSGEIRGSVLHFLPLSGPPRSLNLTHLREAAMNADVNLIILRSRSPRQPGGRNWLWQRVEVGGLKGALKRETFADFLQALGAGGGGTFQVSATSQGRGRVIVEAVFQSQKALLPYSDVVGGWLGEVVSNVTGNVVITGVRAFNRDKERQRELDNRIIPGIPSFYQMIYLGSLIAGLMAWSVSREVWEMIWPPEQRLEYRTSAGFIAARAIKMMVFLLLFLPIVGIPMLVLSVLLQIWTVLSWVWAVLSSPVRVWRWFKQR